MNALKAVFLKTRSLSMVNSHGISLRHVGQNHEDIQQLAPNCRPIPIRSRCLHQASPNLPNSDMYRHLFLRIEWTEIIVNLDDS